MFWKPDHEKKTYLIWVYPISPFKIIFMCISWPFSAPLLFFLPACSAMTTCTVCSVISAHTLELGSSLVMKPVCPSTNEHVSVKELSVSMNKSGKWGQEHIMSVPFVFLDSHMVVHKNFFSSGVSLKFLRENIQSKQPELCFMPLCCLAPAHRWHFLITPHIINISVPIRCIPNFGLTGLNLNLLKYSVWDCRLCQETACLKFTVSSCNDGHVCFVASVCS